MKNALLIFTAALPGLLSAQEAVVERTTPSLLEQSAFSWSSDNRQFVLTDIGVYEASLNIFFLPKFAAGHGFVLGSAMQRTTSLEVFGWELYGRLPIGGDGGFIKGSWGPIVDRIDADGDGSTTYRVTFPLRFSAGIRFSDPRTWMDTT